MQDESFNQFDDLSKFLRDFLKSFQKQGFGKMPSFSVSRTYHYSGQPQGSNGSSVKENSRSKMYSFKDFNIRYHFNPQEPQKCYINLTNVPTENSVQKVYIDKQVVDPSKLKIYIDCGKYFIVDYIKVLNHYRSLGSYSIQKSTNSKVLVLNLKL